MILKFHVPNVNIKKTNSEIEVLQMGQLAFCPEIDDKTQKTIEKR